jgi:phage gp29-like protein
MLDLTRRLSALLARFLPTSGFPMGDHRREPPSMMPTLTADRIASTLAEAERGNTKNLFALYRDVLLADNHMQTELGKRILAVLGAQWEIVPSDPNVEADKKAATEIKAQLKAMPGFLEVCIHLLKASLWPVALVEKTYRQSIRPGIAYDLASLRPVPDTLLDFQDGSMRIELCDSSTGMPSGQFILPEPERYITHRGHLLSMPDNWGGPMRSLLYWFFLGIMDREWWSRFLDKFGTPFFLGKFDRNDNKSRAVLERAFKLSTKIGGLVVNRETQVELKQASVGDTGEAFERFHAVCNREKSKLIVGQTLSAEAQPTGLGSGVSDLQSDVRQDIRQWDELKLKETLRDQLFLPFLRINGMAGSCEIQWGGKPTPELATLAEALAKLADAGLTVGDDGLRELSDIFSLPIVRTATPAPSLALAALARNPATLSLLNAPDADVLKALDAISRSGAADVARDLRVHLATLSAAALRSDTPEAARAALLHFGVADAEAFEAALLAGAFNAAQN